MADRVMLGVRIGEGLHRRLKVAAVEGGVSLQEFVESILVGAVDGSVKREEVPRNPPRAREGVRPVKESPGASVESVESPFSKGAQVKRSRGKGKK